jgi:hypothetical protein
VERVIANGYRTPDVGEEGKIMVGTREMGRLIAETLEH